MLIDYPIIAKNLTFKAGFKKIIDNISIVLKKNEFVGLIGGSGSGKTTLMTCLNGYRKLFDGSVILNGISSKEKNKIRHLIGYVPQDDIVHKTLTVERALYYSYLLRLDDQMTDEKIDSQVAPGIGLRIVNNTGDGEKYGWVIIVQVRISADETGPRHLVRIVRFRNTIPIIPGPQLSGSAV